MNSEKRSNPVIDNVSSELSIKISFRINGTKTALLQPNGKIINVNKGLVQQAFNECFHLDKDGIILDMSGVTFVDIAAWKFIAALQKRIQKNMMRLYICCVKDNLITDFMNTCQGEAEQFTIVPSVKKCQEIIDASYCTPNSKPIQQEVATPVKDESTIPPQIFTAQADSIQNNDKTGMSINVKITTIISQYGPCSIQEILAYLKSDEFNYVKINLLELNRILKEMDLNSFKKRERYYRTT